jgi:hypothetical protein
MMLLLAFVVGAVGNQVLDVVVHDTWTPGYPDYHELYVAWSAQNGKVIAHAATLKIAEHDVGNGSHEYSRAYLLRHKSLIRVMRAAAASALLLLLAMTGYEGARRISKWQVQRYATWHFLLVLVALGVLTFTYFSELSDFQKKVFELSTRCDAKVFCKTGHC